MVEMGSAKNQLKARSLPVNHLSHAPKTDAQPGPIVVTSASPFPSARKHPHRSSKLFRCNADSSIHFVHEKPTLHLPFFLLQNSSLVRWLFPPLYAVCGVALRDSAPQLVVDPGLNRPGKHANPHANAEFQGKELFLFFEEKKWQM